MLRPVLRGIVTRCGRAYPLYRGKATLEDTKFAWWLLADLEHRVCCRLTDGSSILLDPHEAGGHGVYLFGEMDPTVLVFKSRT